MTLELIRNGINCIFEVPTVFLQDLSGLPKEEYELKAYISELEYDMELASRNLQFEEAARIRDKIKELNG